ncbi:MULTISPECIES: DUF3021 family protein [unclassified Paenibacillus]|uniref:DUF3021 family protein n=1 Tax=unclassified Paenibacillus TaxID=185978 RepID=UPI0024054EC9|nr:MULTISPECIES: DUF3021 family protein [unclassified Paenibacillus]MDF9846820.1 hypothetical protein [Paenibacillus sp. PastM-2]MDH6479121.1 hypothetical protein [Paenibacillus sp. PastH-2]MDH6506852.1 hypothetical protein [Paenibacillus sp. PastM-3]
MIIFASVIIIITVLRSIFDPDEAYDLITVYIIMGFSLFCTLTGIILYTPDGVSERNMRIRVIVHFAALEVILVSLAAVTGMVKGFLPTALLVVQIAAVYGIVRLLSWQEDKKEAEQINEKLRLLKMDNRQDG